MALSFDYLLKLEKDVEANIYEMENVVRNTFAYLKNGSREFINTDEIRLIFSFEKKNIHLNRLKKTKKKIEHIKRRISILKTVNRKSIKKRRRKKRRNKISKNQYYTKQFSQSKLRSKLKLKLKSKTKTKKEKEKDKKNGNGNKRVIKKEAKMGMEETNNGYLIPIQNYFHNSRKQNIIEVKNNKKRKCKNSLALIREIKVKDKSYVLCLAQSPDMNYLVAGLDTGVLCIYDFSDISKKEEDKETKVKEKCMMIHDGAIIKIQFSPQKKNTFFTIGIDKKVKLWKLKKKEIYPINILQENDISYKSNFNIVIKKNDEATGETCNCNTYCKKTVSNVTVHFLCDIKFSHHITTCIFHSTVPNVLIIGLINGVTKIVKIKTIYEEDQYKDLYHEIKPDIENDTNKEKEKEKEKEKNREKEIGKDGLVNISMLTNVTNYPMHYNMNSAIPFLSKKSLQFPSSRYLGLSNLHTSRIYMSNSNRSNIIGTCFPSNQHEKEKPSLFKSNSSYAYSKYGGESCGIIGISNVNGNENGNGNGNGNVCCTSAGVGTCTNTDAVFMKYFFETNFTENIDNLQKKRKKIHFLVIVKEIKTGFSICSLAMPFCKKVLCIGLCNGIVNVYSNNYKLKHELMCRKRKGDSNSKGKQVSSIRFNETLLLIIVTTLDSRIRIFDMNTFCLIYKLKGHSNFTQSFESYTILNKIKKRKRKERTEIKIETDTDRDRETETETEVENKKVEVENKKAETENWKNTVKQRKSVSLDRNFFSPIRRGNCVSNIIQKEKQIQNICESNKKEDEPTYVLNVIAASDNGRIYFWDIPFNKYAEKKNSQEIIQTNTNTPKPLLNFLKLQRIKGSHNKKYRLLRNKNIFHTTINKRERKEEKNEKKHNEKTMAEKQNASTFKNDFMSNNILSSLSENVKTNIESNMKEMELLYVNNKHYPSVAFRKRSTIYPRKKESHRKNFFQKIKKNMFPYSSPTNEKNKKETDITENYVNKENLLKSNNVPIPINDNWLVKKTRGVEENKKKCKRDKTVASIKSIGYYVSHENNKLSAFCVSKQFFYNFNFCIPESQKKEKEKNSHRNFIKKIKCALKNRKTRNITNKEKLTKHQKYRVFKQKKTSSSFYNKNFSHGYRSSVTSKSDIIKVTEGSSHYLGKSLNRHFLIITTNGRCIKIYMCTTEM